MRRHAVLWLHWQPPGAVRPHAARPPLTRRKPHRFYFFQGTIFIFSILLPPIAVLLRFGVCKDLFINIILTLCGYIPGHVRVHARLVRVLTPQIHNFFLQNVRNNATKRRRPVWVRKLHLYNPVKEERLRENRRWADRYTNATRPVQHDEEGNAYYLDVDDEEGGYPMARRDAESSDEEEPESAEAPRDGLLEPERFYNEPSGPSGPSPSRRRTRRTDPPTTDVLETAPAAPRSNTLMARTRRFFGGGSSGHGMPAEQAAVGAGGGDAGLDDLDRELMGLPARQKAAPAAPVEEDPEAAAVLAEASAPASDPAVDELDRELTGLPTGARARAARQALRRESISAPRADPVLADSELGEPERDIMDTRHDF